MASPLFNRGRLQEVSSGDEAFEKELVDLFELEMNANFTKLKIAFEESNQKDAILHSHDMKGLAANIGAPRCKEIAEKMEILCKDKKLEESSKLLPSLQETFEETMEVINKEYSK